MTTFWQAVLYTHLLAMAFFLGGQLVVGLALVPVERRNPDPERLRAVARRFGIGSSPGSRWPSTSRCGARTRCG
jgi:putative copper export protein